MTQSPREVEKMVKRLRAELAIDARDRLGESPAWDARAQRLLWSDHALGIVHEARADSAGRWGESRRWTLQPPLAAVIPRASGGLLVVAAAELYTLDETGHVEVLTRLV